MIFAGFLERAGESGMKVVVFRGNRRVRNVALDLC